MRHLQFTHTCKAKDLLKAIKHFMCADRKEKDEEIENQINIDQLADCQHEQEKF